MWWATLWSVFTVFFSIAVLSGVCLSEPGGPCGEDTVPGDCKPINQCPKIIMALRKNETTITEITCYIDGTTPIPYVCCPNGKQPKPKVTTPPPVIQRILEAPADARISVKKCYEYAKLVYTRQKSVALINQYVDIDNCVKSVEGLIVNGQAAQLGEFPHMALLGYGDNATDLEYFCGGSLISEEYVLTAAHCASRSDPTYVLLGEFIVGDDTDGAKPQLIPVAEFISHPKHVTPAHYFDIALIRLSKKAVLTPYLRPACLHSDQPYDPSSLTATGWGRTDFYDTYTSDILMKVTLGEVNNSICNKTHQDPTKLKKGYLPEQQLCVGKLEGGSDTCQGDSGGPLQVFLREPHCSYLVVGVTSFGKGCARKNTPGVYAKVSYFLQWIEDTVWPPDTNNTMTNDTVNNITNDSKDTNSTTTNDTVNNITNDSKEYPESFRMYALENGGSSIIAKTTYQPVLAFIVFYVFSFRYLFNNFI